MFPIHSARSAARSATRTSAIMSVLGRLGAGSTIVSKLRNVQNKISKLRNEASNVKLRNVQNKKKPKGQKEKKNMSRNTPSPTLGHTKNIYVSDSVQIKGGGHLKNNERKTQIIDGEIY
jgi:hypothetical protein